MIDNITWGSDGITTRIGGTTFTHTPRCALHNGQPQIDDDWMHACDCFISHVRTVTFPDGTEVPAEVKRPQWKQLVDERAEAISQARFWRNIAVVLMLTGLASNVAGLGRLSGWW